MKEFLRREKSLDPGTDIGLFCFDRDSKRRKRPGVSRDEGLIREVRGDSQQPEESGHLVVGEDSGEMS